MRLSADLDTVAKSSQDLPLSRRRHAAAVPVEPEQMDRCVDPLPGDNHAGVFLTKIRKIKKERKRQKFLF